MRQMMTMTMTMITMMKKKMMMGGVSASGFGFGGRGVTGFGSDGCGRAIGSGGCDDPFAPCLGHLDRPCRCAGLDFGCVFGGLGCGCATDSDGGDHGCGNESGNAHVSCCC